MLIFWKFKAVRRNSSPDNRSHPSCNDCFRTCKLLLGLAQPWSPKLTKCCNPQGWDPASGAAIPKMWWSLENAPSTTPALVSLCERNLVEVSIAVGQSGDGPKDLPRRPGCHGDKHFGQFLLPHRRKQKWSYRRRVFRPKPSRTLAVLDDSTWLLSFWWLWACSMVNSFSSVNRIRSQFREATR